MTDFDPATLSKLALAQQAAAELRAHLADAMDDLRDREQFGDPDWNALYFAHMRADTAWYVAQHLAAGLHFDERYRSSRGTPMPAQSKFEAEAACFNRYVAAGYERDVARRLTADATFTQYGPDRWHETSPFPEAKLPNHQLRGRGIAIDVIAQFRELEGAIDIQEFLTVMQAAHTEPSARQALLKAVDITRICPVTGDDLTVESTVLFDVTYLHRDGMGGADAMTLAVSRTAWESGLAARVRRAMDAAAEARRPEAVELTWVGGWDIPATGHHSEFNDPAIEEVVYVWSSYDNPPAQGTATADQLRAWWAEQNERHEAERRERIAAQD